MQVKRIPDEVRFDAARMAKVNLFETARFFCDLYCLRPGQSQRVHTHDENDKVYHVVRGEARVTVGSEERVIRAGEVALASAREPHGIANESEEDLVCVVFMAPHPEASRFPA
jgi:mannose-6-phosphate isomerase-like protein (cupin superfamily)